MRGRYAESVATNHQIGDWRVPLLGKTVLPRALTAQHRLPTIYQFREYAVAGGANLFLDEHAEGSVEFLVGTGFGDDDPLMNLMRCLLQFLQLTGGGWEGWIQQYPDRNRGGMQRRDAWTLPATWHS